MSISTTPCHSVLMYSFTFPLITVIANIVIFLQQVPIIPPGWSPAIATLFIISASITALILSVLSYVKAKSQDRKIDNALDTAMSVGKLATAMTNKVLENKESIKAAVELGLRVTPEDAQKSIAEKQAHRQTK
jgi:hypothetical protein